MTDSTNQQPEDVGGDVVGDANAEVAGADERPGDAGSTTGEPVDEPTDQPVENATGDAEDAETNPASVPDGEVHSEAADTLTPEEVAVVVAERDQYRDAAVRLQADFENFRKRTTSQSVADIDRATGRIVEALLPVLDAAETAYVSHPDEVGPLFNALLAELGKQGLETVDLDGAEFDPEVAEAVAHEPGEGGEVRVADVLRSGYRWKGKTLRPAMVRTTD